MITPGFRFEGFSANDWSRLLSLTSPDSVVQPSQSHARLWVMADADGEVLRANHSVFGRLGGLPRVSARDLKPLALAHGVNQVVFVREGASEALAEAFQARVRPDDDWLDQWLLILQEVRVLQRDGALGVWPDPSAKLPVPSRRAVLRAMDLVWPAHRSVLIATSTRGEPDAFALIARGATVIDRVVGPDALPELIGMDFAEVFAAPQMAVDALAHRFAPVHAGVFAERQVLSPLLTTYRPGQWARAAARGHLRLVPAPHFATAALALDGLLGFVPPLAARLRGPLGRLLVHLRRAQALVGQSPFPGAPPAPHP